MDVDLLQFPVNRTASTVTQQSVSDDIAVLRQDRDSLLFAQQRIAQMIDSGEITKKQVVSRRLNIANQLREIKSKIKAINISIANDKTEQDWILKECASLFSKDDWEAITHRARQKMINSED